MWDSATQSIATHAHDIISPMSFWIHFQYSCLAVDNGTTVAVNHLAGKGRTVG